MEQVAALLADRRKRVSLRRLAGQVGISKSAVDGLVQAYHQVREMPQPHANWQKLKDWYLREKYAQAGELSEPVDMAVLALEMVGKIPEAERRDAVLELVRAVGEIYDRRRVPRPAWLTQLADAARDEGTRGG
ncbi:MAG TPA: hypothetical protein VFJ16_09910 [Longimicrobium sp.]|nr:hypothetical protein [Longimicrobium sp.]